MKLTGTKWFFLVFVLGGLTAGLFWFSGSSTSEPDSSAAHGNGIRPVPVEVMPIEHGSIELRRTFSGALESRAEFIVAPKVSGRVERLSVNISDPIKRGQVVGELDNDEYVQAVAQVRADLAVAEAKLA